MQGATTKAHPKRYVEEEQRSRRLPPPQPSGPRRILRPDAGVTALVVLLIALRVGPAAVNDVGQGVVTCRTADSLSHRSQGLS